MEAEVSSRTSSCELVSPSIALEEAAVGAGEDVPIDVAQVVALGVGAVLGELLGEAEVRRAVESGDEAVDHGLGDQVERRRWKREWPDRGSAVALVWPHR